MRLLLARHGETEHNLRGITLGRADVPLTERGKSQARALAATFDLPPDAIYCSPLMRARETAEAVSARTGTPYVIDDALVEMDVGEMEHLTPEELRAEHGEFLRAWLGEGVADVRMPGGETLREVQARAWAAVERMREQHDDGRVLAVTHNFVIRALLCRAASVPLAGFRSLRVGLGSLSVIDITSERALTLEINATGHLLAGGVADDEGEGK